MLASYLTFRLGECSDMCLGSPHVLGSFAASHNRTGGPAQADLDVTDRPGAVVAASIEHGDACEVDVSVRVGAETGFQHGRSRMEHDRFARPRDYQHRAAENGLGELSALSAESLWLHDTDVHGASGEVACIGPV
jgi:hypothetical protein